MSNDDPREYFLFTIIIHIHNRFLDSTVVPRPLSNDPRFTQCIYRYSRASKRFVEVYMIVFLGNNIQSLTSLR